MQRIMIVGSGGAGKSTLARQLGLRVGLPVYHLDAVFWKPGWIMTPPAEELAILQEIVAEDAWIIDGNYGGATTAPRLAAADTVIMLDFPRSLCLLRAVRRWLTYRNRTRPDSGPGCPERLDRGYLRWIWEYPASHRPRMLARIEDHAGHSTLLRFRSPREVKKFLSLTPPAAGVTLRPISD